MKLWLRQARGAERGYTAGEKNYSSQVSRLDQNAIDVVNLSGYHTEAGLIVRKMPAQSMKPKSLSGDGLLTDENKSINCHVGEGTLVTCSPDTRKNPVPNRWSKCSARVDINQGAIYPLHLRGDPGLGKGGRAGRHYRYREGRNSSAIFEVRYRLGKIDVGKKAT